MYFNWAIKFKSQYIINYNLNYDNYIQIQVVPAPNYFLKNKTERNKNMNLIKNDNIENNETVFWHNRKKYLLVKLFKDLIILILFI